MSKTILLLPGDGIGPEIINQARRVLEWFQRQNPHIQITIAEDLIGGAAYERYGTPLAASTLDAARQADAILLGAVGGPRWSSVPYDKRPEAALLGIRKQLELFANLRPAVAFDALLDSSTLKPAILRGLDLLIVRELIGGIYFGEPQGITDLGNGQRRGVNTQVYTTHEIHRIARVAFEHARQRRNQVCSCDKSNVMQSGLLWREEVTKLHAAEYRDVQLSHIYADTCAMQLANKPSQFDVILTDNLLGDILSDEAAMLTGSIGMLPSASVGASTSDGRQLAIYEPAHGSAPDIAGKEIANPLASILSVAMMLRYSFNDAAAASAVENAVRSVLDAGIRTADILTPGITPVSTTAMGDAVLDALSSTPYPTPKLMNPNDRARLG